MLTYNELLELRNKLENDDIELPLVKEKYWNDFKEEQRSWHTRDWKERRLNFIKDKCEKCGSKEILTIQHLSHPKKYSEHLKKTTKKYTKDYINDKTDIINQSEFIDYVLKNYEYIPVPLCPNCMSRNPNKRTRKTPQYLCTECRYEFDEIVYKTVAELISNFYINEETTEVGDKCFKSKKWKKQNNLSSIKYWYNREYAQIKNLNRIEKEAFLNFLNDNIKYLSFEDTITACNKCASNFDLNHSELCPKCKTNYKGIQYPTCIQCLPEDKRKIVLEKTEFEKEIKNIHKNLGID